VLLHNDSRESTVCREGLTRPTMFLQNMNAPDRFAPSTQGFRYASSPGCCDPRYPFPVRTSGIHGPCRRAKRIVSGQETSDITVISTSSLLQVQKIARSRALHGAPTRQAFPHPRGGGTRARWFSLCTSSKVRTGIIKHCLICHNGCSYGP